MQSDPVFEPVRLTIHVILLKRRRRWTSEVGRSNDGGKEMGRERTGRREWSLEIPKSMLEMAKRRQTGRTPLEQATS